MRLHRICGVRFRSHLRSYARAYAYRGLTAFASLSMAVSDGQQANHQPLFVTHAMASMFNNTFRIFHRCKFMLLNPPHTN
ncbi:MAG: hypothetical protein ABW087_19755 [Candidatus Thiodiazotropha sp.]